MDRQGDESDEQQRDGDELMWEKERGSILNVQPGGVTEVWVRKKRGRGDARDYTGCKKFTKDKECLERPGTERGKGMKKDG